MDRPRASVLLVEHDEALRRDTTQGLREAGFMVTSFGNGTQAFRALRKDVPDALLTELRLPGTCGMDLIREIRTRAPQAVVIVISAAREVGAVIESFRAGAKDFFVKPFSLDDLIFCLQNLLVEAQALRARSDAAHELTAVGSGAVCEAAEAYGNGPLTDSLALTRSFRGATDEIENLKQATRLFERRHILQVLQAHAGKRTATAYALGIGLSSLYRKMEELGIPRRASTPAVQEARERG